MGTGYQKAPCGAFHQDEYDMANCCDNCFKRLKAKHQKEIQEEIERGY